MTVYRSSTYDQPVCIIKEKVFQEHGERRVRGHRGHRGRRARRVREHRGWKIDIFLFLLSLLIHYILRKVFFYFF